MENLERTKNRHHRNRGNGEKEADEMKAINTQGLMHWEVKIQVEVL